MLLCVCVDRLVWIAASRRCKNWSGEWYRGDGGNRSGIAAGRFWASAAVRRHSCRVDRHCRQDVSLRVAVDSTRVRMTYRVVGSSERDPKSIATVFGQGIRDDHKDLRETRCSTETCVRVAIVALSRVDQASRSSVIDF